ncbi:MAG: tRNA-binding protein [Tumebacillaceae bacterium]
MAELATFEDFQKLEVRTGVITEVEDFPRAKNPSFKVTVDFGEEFGTKRSSVQATNYEKEQLIGMQVVCVVNFAPRNIAGFQSEVLVLGVPGVDGKLSLLTPSKPAKVGGHLY